MIQSSRTLLAAVSLTCLFAAGGAVMMNVLSYIRPTVVPTEALFRLNAVVSRATIAWGVTIALVLMVLSLIKKGDLGWVLGEVGPGVVLVSIVLVLFLFINGMLLSSPRSIRQSEAGWEAGGRFRGWDGVTREVATAELWEGLRAQSGLILIEAVVSSYVLFCVARTK